MKTTANNNLAIPVAIVIAGALIATAVFLSNGKTESVTAQGGTKPEVAQAPTQPTQAASLDAMAAVTQQDHILGNPNAKVKIVEYSDFECPFCKRFHATMNQVMDEYGESGDVAWVYRQFPLDSLHPVKARQEALATECAAEQGDNDMFWKYADRMFELTLTNNRTDVDTVLPQIASELGLDTAEFASCMENETYAAEIEKDVQNAIATGGGGTPWSILVAADGTKYPINGAQPYEAVRQLIEQALSKSL